MIPTATHPETAFKMVREGPGRTRMGTLFSGPKLMQTPHYVLGSVRGSTPHLTPDLAHTLDQYRSLHVGAGEMASLVPAIKAYGTALAVDRPYHSMSFLREDQTVVYGLRNPVTDLAYCLGRYLATPEQRDNEEKFPYQLRAKVACARADIGVIRLTPDQFLGHAAVIQPDILVLAGQDSAASDTKSRSEKIMRRNIEWVDQCLMRSVNYFTVPNEKISPIILRKTAAVIAAERQSSVPQDYKMHYFDVSTDSRPPAPMIIAPIEGGPFADKRQRHGGVMSRKGTEIWVDVDEPTLATSGTEEQLRSDLRKYDDRVLNEGLAVPVRPDGFHLGGMGTTPDRPTRLHMLRASLDFIETNDAALGYEYSRFRMTTSTGEPAELIDILMSGVDLVTATYPLVASEEGLAINIPISTADLQAVVDDPGFAALTESEKVYKYNVMDLRDGQFIDDASPISVHCRCYTCQNHSRSYLNHLLNTQEMLADVLLMIHNTDQYGLFFQHYKQLLQISCEILPPKPKLQITFEPSISPDSPGLPVRIEPADATPEVQTPLHKWYELAQAVYMPHVHSLQRNVRRRYQHQEAAENPNPLGPLQEKTSHHAQLHVAQERAAVQAAKEAKQAASRAAAIEQQELAALAREQAGEVAEPKSNKKNDSKRK